jgi:hypothetical protein
VGSFIPQTDYVQQADLSEFALARRILKIHLTSRSQEN